MVSVKDFFVGTVVLHKGFDGIIGAYGAVVVGQRGSGGVDNGVGQRIQEVKMFGNVFRFSPFAMRFVQARPRD